MLNIVEFLYKRGINFTYEYEERINRIKIEESQMNDVVKRELWDLCYQNPVSFGSGHNVTTIEYTPYV